MKNILITAIIACLLGNSQVLYAQEENSPKTKEFMTVINSNTKETNKILIVEKPQAVYRLELKEGKPFAGYEVTTEKLLGEFPFVNYYEKGQLIAKYAVNYIAKDQYGTPIEYSLKTSYKDGKIVDGADYRMVSNHMLLTDTYKDGQKVGLNVDLFAMHYFNRVSFEIKKETLQVNRMETVDGLVIYKQDVFVVADYMQAGEKVESSSVIFEKCSQAAPESTTVYYLDDKENLKQLNLIHRAREPISTNDHILNQLYMQFSFKFDGDIKAFLAAIDKLLTEQNEESDGFNRVFESLMVPYTEESMISYLFYDAAGLPLDGSKMEVNPDGSFTKTTYQEGQITQKDQLKTLKK